MNPACTGEQLPILFFLQNFIAFLEWLSSKVNGVIVDVGTVQAVPVA